MKKIEKCVIIPVDMLILIIVFYVWAITAAFAAWSKLVILSPYY